MSHVAQRGTIDDSATAASHSLALTDPTAIAVGSMLTISFAANWAAGRSLGSITDPRNTWTIDEQDNNGISFMGGSASCQVDTVYQEGDALELVWAGGNIVHISARADEWDGFDSPAVVAESAAATDGTFDSTSAGTGSTGQLLVGALCTWGTQGTVTPTARTPPWVALGVAGSTTSHRYTGGHYRILEDDDDPQQYDGAESNARDNVAVVAVYAPTASGPTPISAEVDAILPAIQVDATGIVREDITAAVDAILPVVQVDISVVVLLPINAAIDAILPALEVDAEATHAVAAVTYDDVSLDYDEPSRLYDGIEIGSGMVLLVDGADVTDELADRSLRVRTATHGNSLGTLDATLNDPAAVPVTEDGVDLFFDLERLYKGHVRALNVDEYHGGHLFAALSAQDAGADEGALPTAAPFGISDDPDGSTTKGYESLSKQTRTTEGGSAKTTFSLVVREHGLQPGMNVEVTSANYGLAAEEFTIREMSVQWPNAAAPRYEMTLGDPLVSLAQVVADHEVPDGSITETKIGPGAITTPKLSADAVIANVANVGETVVIDSTGIEITNGSMRVVNPEGNVIIDGNSDMFRIAATGTLSLAAQAGPGQVTDQIDLSLGFEYAPAFIGFLQTPSGAVRHLPYTVFNSSTDPGRAIDWFSMRVELVDTDTTRVIGFKTTTRVDGAQAYTMGFYILEQAAI